MEEFELTSGLENDNKSIEEIGKEIRDSSYSLSKKYFDFDVIFEFCQNHRVEVLLQDDLQYHCIIDYHLEKTGSWAIEFDSFTALIRGIYEYKRRKSK